MLTNKLGLPQPFVDAATASNEYTKDRYSVTAILGSQCEAILKRRHHDEIDDDVADRVWAIFGSAVHKVLQEAKATDSQLQENWLAVPIEGTKYTLSGIFDLYDAETATVTDYKTCSVWKTQVGDFDDWQMQVLIYCWMLRKTGFQADHGEIVAIMRDHNMRKAKTEQGYPPHPVMKLSWDFTDDDFYFVELYIKDWFAELAKQEQLPDDCLTPCGLEQRWHKPDKYAIMEKGKKRALKLCDSQEEAEEYAAQRGIDLGGKTYFVEFRKGEDTK